MTITAIFLKLCGTLVGVQDYLRRDQEGRIDKHGRIWGVPYRWGSMVVAFRKDKLSRNNIPGIEVFTTIVI
mgnify:FL=1